MRGVKGDRRDGPRRTAVAGPWIVALAAVLGAPPPSVAQATRADPPIVVVRDVRYREGADATAAFDVYRPDVAESRPAVMVLHGGGWVSGHRAAGDASTVARRLAEAGYVAVSAGYRLAPKATWPAQLDDVRLAMRTLRANAGRFRVDPSRIASFGTSAGGHLAAFLCVADDAADPSAEDPIARMSSKAACAVAYCAPMDLADEAGGTTPAGLRTVVNLLSGSAFIRDAETLEKARPLAVRASPATYVDPSDGPLLLVYGEFDPIVPPSQALRMRERCVKAGVPCVLHEVRKGGHGEFVFQLRSPEGAAKSDVWARTLAFLRDRLGPPQGPTSRPSSAERPPARPRSTDSRRSR
jgi:acetyl esterase/lipase